MKTLFILLSLTLSFSIFLGCGETDAPVETVIAPRSSSLPPIPSVKAERYPKGWVHLTDNDVEVLLKLEVPIRWWETEDEALRQKFDFALLLKEVGDLPQARFIIEFLGQPPEVHRTPELLLTFSEYVYFLWPNEQNKQALEQVRADMPEEVPIPVPDPPPLPTLQDIEAERVALLEKHEDIPQVEIVVNFKKKVVRREFVTDDEVFAYRKARFELDPEDQPNRMFFEAYLQAKANGQPLETVNEREILEKWLQTQE